VIDGELDEGALDDRQFPLVACPGAAGLQLGVHAVPGAGVCGPYREVCVVVCTSGPGQAASSDSLSSQPCRIGGPIWPGRRGGGACPQHPVGAQPPQHLHGKVPEQPGQPGRLVAGVEDHHDVRVAIVPVPGGGDPLVARHSPAVTGGPPGASPAASATATYLRTLCRPPDYADMVPRAGAGGDARGREVRIISGCRGRPSHAGHPASARRGAVHPLPARGTRFGAGTGRRSQRGER